MCGRGVLLQIEYQMVKKDNDFNREKQIKSKMMGDMELGQQQMLEVSVQLEHTKNTVGLLQREIKTQQEVIGEQKVSTFIVYVSFLILVCFPTSKIAVSPICINIY